jgi:spore maturation protein CgeB
MKILLVGSNFKYGIEQYYIKYLRDMGSEIVHYPAQDISMQDRSRNLFTKILFKAGLYRGYGKINMELTRLAEQENPDVIWIFKGMEILPETLKKLRKDFKLANYNPDHPYIIAGSGSGNKNVTGSVGLYHLHFCYNSMLQKQIEARFNIPTVFLPFGFELSLSEYTNACVKQEVGKICFIGNPDKTRYDVIAFLAKNGFEVDVYGHGWDQTAVKKLRNVSHFDAIYGSDFWDKLRQYRVQLNIFRKHNIDSHNMRSFEIPAVGGIQLTPYSSEQAGFFSEGSEIFFYKTFPELLDQVKKIMELPEEKINSFREAARARSVNSGYSYRDRASTVYESFKKLTG